MKIAKVTIKSVSPYSQSRAHNTEKLSRETADDFENRTWKNKSHTNENEEIFIPPMAFKMALDKAAKMLGIQIPGKGKATYTKFFESGVLVMDKLLLGVKKEDVMVDVIHANADGVRGSGKRVWKKFPRIDEWQGILNYHILADEITEEVFERSIKQSGSFVGIGRFRPENGGFYGRFEVTDIEWQHVG